MNNDSGANTPMQERLNQLGVKFLQRTMGEIASLRDCLARARSGESQALEPLQHLAHKIHGTGATLGFAAISVCAEKIERLAEQATGSASPVNPAQLKELEELTVQLHHEIVLAGNARGLPE
jgi:HPt (histidine-containing phosphotransfer) domain-containing protein